MSYQGQDLTRHEEGINFPKTHQTEYFEAVDACIKNREKTRETKILAHSITILAIHGWDRSPTPAFAHTALNAVCQCFSTPLESSSIDIFLLQGEWGDMVEYGWQYINLVQDDYSCVVEAIQLC